MNPRVFQPYCSHLLDAFRSLFLQRGKVLSRFVIYEFLHAKIALTRTSKKLYLCIDEAGDGYQTTREVEAQEVINFVQRLRSSKGGQGQVGPWKYDIHAEKVVALHLKSRFNVGAIGLDNAGFSWTVLEDLEVWLLKFTSSSAEQKAPENHNKGIRRLELSALAPAGESVIEIELAAAKKP